MSDMSGNDFGKSLNKPVVRPITDSYDKPPVRQGVDQRSVNKPPVRPASQPKPPKK